ncbi:HNH endonuclease [Bacillus cytotoxicus]|uniref:HNH endonuclease n=1 Tax=Bacillus cytotoxicus TaxID=580165 RepID=UPI0015D740C2|nr:HNH endonuclease [Bacillus cytotoxicus]MDH2864607.1 HNH endonuclease [Bacillus cytotoxicus]NZD33227.1 HNH endonuclease [Bacillus cytotoxicus]QTR84535.1 HNH endonuclease [Bacillus cytotoxicus]HDR7213472.1 HNH endonuclease [Bacillus cytotoxicus]
MSLNMYLGEVQTQTEGMNAFCTATIQGMEQAIQSIDAFAIDTVLQGQTYSSAKAFFVQTFRPLAQGIIYLCEELIRQNDAFPSQFQSQVASTDVIEQEILEQIREIDRMIASTEAINQTMPIPGMDAMVNLFAVMRRKLQEKLEHLYEFNQTSSDNYNTAIQLATSIATGLAEVQSGKGFSPASGTFSTQGLNMEWAASIQAIGEERARQAENHLKSSSIEEGAMCGPLNSEKKDESLLDKFKHGVEDFYRKYSKIKAVTDDKIAAAFEKAGLGVPYHIKKGMDNALGGELLGIANAALHPINTFNDTIEAFSDPTGTFNAIKQTISDSWNRDVTNGDWNSRAEWYGNAMGHGMFAVAGTKGVDKISKVGEVAAMTSLTKGESLITNSSAYRNALHILNNYEFKAGNHLSYAGVGSIQQYLQKAAPYTYEGPNGPKTIRLRKGELAGDKHPVTGIPYDADGFPIFKSKGEVILKEADFKKSRTTHFRKCSKALYEQIIKDPDLASKFTKEEIQMFKQGETPKHYTWHHHQDTGRMQLVNYQIHHDTGHTGGYRILGKDSDK